MNAPAKIGDNSVALISADLLKRDHAKVIEGIDGFEKEAGDLPPVCEDDEDVALIAATVEKLNAATKRIDEIRAAAKAPYFDATNVVDGFFGAKDKPKAGTLQKRVADLKATLTTRVHAYQVKKAEAERKRREEEAARQREEADRLQREAIAAAQSAPAGDRTTADAAFTRAADASRVADAAALATQAKPADLGRSMGAGGKVAATLTEEWTHEIENFSKIDLEKLRNYFGPSDIASAIARFVKSGGRELGGVKIFPVTKTRI
jgi:hypothetical protein